jgi:hypothetical protein
MFSKSSLLPPWFHQPQIAFSGSNADVWTEFLQYFENLAELNAWGQEKSRRVLLSTLRGQAETFAYGLPPPLLENECPFGSGLMQNVPERSGTFPKPCGS